MRRPGQLRGLLPTALPLEGLGAQGTSTAGLFPTFSPQAPRSQGSGSQTRRLTAVGDCPPIPGVEATEPQALRAKAMKAPSTGLSTQLPGALWPASSPVHPLGGWGAVPCFSEFESQQLCSCDHTLLSDLLKSGEKPRRNRHFFPRRGLGPQEPWSPGDGAALCTRAGLGQGTWAGTRARLSAPPGVPGQDTGSRQWAQAQDGVGRWGVCAVLRALLYFPT